jgi:hypothetical protein
MFKAFQSMKGKNKIFIHEDHECKMGLMTTQDLLKHLKNEGDCTHTAVCIYLEKLNTSLQKRCTKTPIEKYNLEVASWTTTCQITTSDSSLVFEDNVSKDGLSSQLTYKVNINFP